MTLHLYPALATCLAVLVYFGTFVSAGRARGKYGIKAPAVTGHIEFEKRLRVQQNTLEQLALFLPALWVFSTTWNQFWGGILGLVWVAGRVLYAVTYTTAPESRGPGFTISLIAMAVLLFGGTARVLWLMITGIP